MGLLNCYYYYITTYILTLKPDTMDLVVSLRLGSSYIHT